MCQTYWLVGTVPTASVSLCNAGDQQEVAINISNTTDIMVICWTSMCTFTMRYKGQRLDYDGGLTS